MLSRALLFLCGVSACAAGHDYITKTISVKSDYYDVGTENEKILEREYGFPADTVRLKAFGIDKYPVTNSQYRSFVRETKYVTESEKFGWSFVFVRGLQEDVVNASESIKEAPWWVARMGAYWRQPEGKGSGISDREHYPVIHVSLKDAISYCEWAGKRLPTELEWEAAVRGELEEEELPWKIDDSLGRMNFWQGDFPGKAAPLDGYLRTNPVDAFPAQTQSGLHDMLGNVWEWTTSPFLNRQAPASEEETTQVVLRGGSYVDTADGKHNHRIRPITRMGNEPDAGSDNLGFRCVNSYSESYVPENRERKPRKATMPSKDRKAKQEL